MYDTICCIFILLFGATTNNEETWPPWTVDYNDGCKKGVTVSPKGQTKAANTQHTELQSCYNKWSYIKERLYCNPCGFEILSFWKAITTTTTKTVVI